MVTRSFLTFSESGSRDGNLVAVQLAGIVVLRHELQLRPLRVHADTGVSP